jgi:hypothetical protein
MSVAMYLVPLRCVASGQHAWDNTSHAATVPLRQWRHATQALVGLQVW